LINLRLIKLALGTFPASQVQVLMKKFFGNKRLRSLLILSTIIAVSMPALNLWFVHNSFTKELAEQTAVEAVRAGRHLMSMLKLHQLETVDDTMPPEFLKKYDITARRESFDRMLIISTGMLILMSLVFIGSLALALYIAWKDTYRREQSEKTLRENEEKYSLLVKNLPSIVYWGFKDWSVKYVDDKIEQFSGYRQDEFSFKKK